MRTSYVDHLEKLIRNEVIEPLLSECKSELLPLQQSRLSERKRQIDPAKEQLENFEISTFSLATRYSASELQLHQPFSVPGVSRLDLSFGDRD